MSFIKIEVPTDAVNPINNFEPVKELILIPIKVPIVSLKILIIGDNHEFIFEDKFGASIIDCKNKS